MLRAENFILFRADNKGGAGYFFYLFRRVKAAARGGKYAESYKLLRGREAEHIYKRVSVFFQKFIRINIVEKALNKASRFAL